MATEALVPDLGLESVEITGAEGQQPEQQQTATPPDPKQAEREFSQWLKSRKEDGEDGKFYRRIKDLHGRHLELSRLDPKGIEGIRERYAALDGVAYGDKKGLDAISTMQAALAESQSALDAIAQGDLDALTEEQQSGALRMVPNLLRRLADSDPEAYTNAVLPDFVEALKSSELVTSYDALVDALNEKPPAWLKPEQRAEWTNDRLNRVLQHVGNMGKWFQAQDQRVKDLGKQENGTRPRLDGAKPVENAEKTTTANPQFWKENVYPDTNAHAEQSFDKELRPWAEKLAKAGFRLSDAKKTALAGEFVKGVIAEALKNNDYRQQMSRYDRQRNPDKASVVALFRSEFNKHAPRVLESLIRRDYGQILDKRTAPRPNGNGNPTEKPKPTAPAAPGVQVVSVRPRKQDIDYPRTPTDWLYQDKYRLKNGKVVQYRP